MKTLILTSSGFLFPEVRQAVVEHLPQERPLNVAYIPAASEVVKDSSYAKRDLAMMDELGFRVDTIDLAEVQGPALRQRLKASRVVYVQGSNGFYLLKLARESGFLNLVKEMVEEGELIYVGKSAGSYLACPTLEVHTWHSKTWRTFGVTDLRAMGLVDFLIQAHYTVEDRTAIKKGLATSNYDLRLLTNRQALFVSGKRVELLGEQPESVLGT